MNSSSEVVIIVRLSDQTTLYFNLTQYLEFVKSVLNAMALRHFNTITLLYVRPIISLIGFLLNLMSVVVFANSKLHKKATTHLFKYFLIKSIFDALSLLVLAMSPIYYALFYKQPNRLNLAVNGFHKVFVVYFSSVFTTAATLFEIAATLNRYLFLAGQGSFLNRWEFFKKFTWRWNTGIILVYCFAFNSFHLVNMRIEKRNASDHYRLNLTQVEDYPVYSIDYDGIPDKQAAKALYMTASVIRDLLSTIVLIYVNVKLCRLLTKTFTTKRALLMMASTLLGAETSKKLDRIENKTTAMVVLISTFTILMHLPYVIFYMNLKPLESVREYIGDVQGCVYCFFQSISIFPYMFNKKFKFAFDELFRPNRKKSQPNSPAATINVIKPILD